MKISCSWSGGKDSCYALMQALKAGHKALALVNMMNENGKISRSHGLPLSILQQQAAAMQLPVIAIPTTWEDYEKNFIQVLNKVKSTYTIEAMVFGDIDLQAHRDWEEMVCNKSGLQAILPIWQQDRKVLVHQMIDAGIETMIVSCNTTMGERFLGKLLSKELVNELEAVGVDVCGENGEFHTLVLNCPLFAKGIELPSYTTVLHNDYWFVQWNDH
jgi:diphthine-ammonia ligase